MQTDQIGNVTINDARKPTQTPPAQKQEQEKPRERTEKQKADWEKVKDRVASRMFPNSKPDDEKGDKKGDKPPAKPADKEKGEKGTATNKDGQSDKPKDRPSDRPKEPADGGDGKPSATEATEQKPKLKPVTKGETAPPVDYEKLATTVAAATAKAIKGEEKPKPEKADDDIPEERRHLLPAIEHLAKTNAKYKGKVEDYKKFAKAEGEYVAQWEKDNPGAKFDPDSDEHSEFYDKHEPDIDPDDITEARVELAAERKAKELAGQTNEKIAALELERDIERSEREVPAYIQRNIAMVGSAMGEEVAKALAELKEGELLEDRDPAAHMTLMTVLPELNAQTIAATRIFGTEGRAYNGSDPVHRAVANAARELEKMLLDQGDEKLTDAHGRKYATLDQWANMPKEQRTKHWTITADLMSAHLANNAAQKAEETYKSEREKVEKLAKAYGWHKTGESQPARTTDARELEERETGREKPRSPSTSTRSVIQPGGGASPKTAQDGGERMLGRMFGR